MDEVNVYFSDFFGIDEDVIEGYGAVNISLINDLPLFIDPFLLFNSDNPEYQQIHNEIIEYLLFLQKQSELHPYLSRGMLHSWYMFSEVKQTWLGFSLEGNAGLGLGTDFARNLHAGLNSIFKDFGKETVPKSPHMEKLCLISPNVGRDKISDFTTNFSKLYLLKYTQEFVRTYLLPEQCKCFTIPKVTFNYETMTWNAGQYVLPSYNDDYIILTPKSMLTRDDTFINRTDMLHNLERIAPSIGDAALRFELDNYFSNVLHKKNKDIPKTEKERAAVTLIQEHPELIDYYMKFKEDHEEEATSISKQVVQEVKMLFNDQLRELIRFLKENSEFYTKSIPDSLEEAKKRVYYLKHAIEDQDCYRIFYIKDKPVRRESDLQIMYRLVWFASEMDVNREVNNGRGPVDYKVSYGAKNATLVEFKLASNKALKRNLEKQVEIYKQANLTDKAIKVIVFFTDDEQKKLNDILNELGLQSCDEIIQIDARNDNKPSASTAR